MPVTCDYPNWLYGPMSSWGDDTGSNYEYLRGHMVYPHYFTVGAADTWNVAYYTDGSANADPDAGTVTLTPGVWHVTAFSDFIATTADPRDYTSATVGLALQNNFNDDYLVGWDTSTSFVVFNQGDPWGATFTQNLALCAIFTVPVTANFYLVNTSWTAFAEDTLYTRNAGLTAIRLR